MSQGPSRHLQPFARSCLERGGGTGPRHSPESVREFDLPAECSQRKRSSTFYPHMAIVCRVDSPARDGVAIHWGATGGLPGKRPVSEEASDLAAAPFLLRHHHQDQAGRVCGIVIDGLADRKSTRLNSSHLVISYA